MQLEAVLETCAGRQDLRSGDLNLKGHSRAQPLGWFNLLLCFCCYLICLCFCFVLSCFEIWAAHMWEQGFPIQAEIFLPRTVRRWVCDPYRAKGHCRFSTDPRLACYHLSTCHLLLTPLEVMKGWQQIAICKAMPWAIRFCYTWVFWRTLSCCSVF